MIEHQVYLEFPRVKNKKEKTSSVSAPVVECLALHCTSICCHALTEGSLSPVGIRAISEGSVEVWLTRR